MAARRPSKKVRRRRLAAGLFCLILFAGLIAGGVWLVQRIMAADGPLPPANSAPVVNPTSATTAETTRPTDPPDPTIRPVASATVVNTGDILIHSPLLSNAAQSDGSYVFDPLFSVVKPYVEAADFATINLELSLPGSNYSGFPRFRTPDSLVDALLTAGFDLVTTANNHSNDGGADGFLRTMQVLQQKGLPFIGTRPAEQDKPYRVEQIGPVAVGMINYTYGTYLQDGRKALNGIACSTVTSPLVNMFDAGDLPRFYAEMEAALAAMRQDGAEVLVVYIHWGNEYRLTTTAVQRNIAQKLCDMGVDVIVGSHPHVVEPVDVLHSDVSGKNTLCVYSMGNAISNQRIQFMDDVKSGHTEDGMLFSFTMTKYTDGSVRVTGADILPTWVHLYSEGSKRIYQIVPLDKSVEDWTVFGLNKSKTGLADAQKSYDRTMKIISEGLETFRQHFAAQQQALDEKNARLLAG